MAEQTHDAARRDGMPDDGRALEVPDFDADPVAATIGTPISDELRDGRFSPSDPAYDHLRGTAGEEQVQMDADERRFIRRRSLKLLAHLSQGVRAKLLLTVACVLIAQAAQASTPMIIAWAIDWGLPRMTEGEMIGMWLPGSAYVVAALTAGLLIMAYTRMTASVSQQMLFTLRGEVFRQTQQLSLDFHEEYTSGKVISRQTSDLESLRELLDGGINSLVQGVMFMIFTAISIWIMDWRSGLLLLAVAVPIGFLGRWYQLRSEVAYRRTRISSARMIVHFVETMTGIRAVQAFRRETARSRQYRRLAGAYRDDMVHSLGLFGILQPTLMALGNLTVTAVLVWGGFRVLSGDLDVGILVALLLATKRVFQPLDMIAMFYNSLQSATAALEKVSGLLEEQPTIEEAEEPQHLDSCAGDVRFSDAAFRYTEDGPTVLGPLDLHIPAGQTVAVVGTTGAGKSTLVKLLARFYDVSSGSLTLDDVDLRELALDDHHRHVAMVTQEAFLFSGSIRDNIALGRPDAVEEEIVEAAWTVGAHEFIASLPEGYDTDVSSRGGRLSAGQRQLISFARAFLADPAVLILDEATSSLDLPSEQLVQQGLQKLLGHRTALIIAHRLSTVTIADRVLVVDHGQIVEDGSPDELIAAGGYFSRLHAAWETSMSS